jgi:hypothetical protein
MFHRDPTTVQSVVERRKRVNDFINDTFLLLISIVLDLQGESEKNGREMKNEKKNADANGLIIIDLTLDQLDVASNPRMHDL